MPKKILSEEDWPLEWTTVSYKKYARARRTSLLYPTLKQLPPISLFKALKKRRTQRDFNDKKKISFEELSTILSYCCGEITPERMRGEKRRMYPSAGALYPLEIYIALKNNASVQKLSAGIYHYYVPQHKLEKIMDGEYTKEMKSFFATREWDSANCLVLISARFQRPLSKYKNLSYRFMLLEAGAILQNIYLVATALGLKVGAAGFDDTQVNRLLDFDDIEESTLSVVALGK